MCGSVGNGNSGAGGGAGFNGGSNGGGDESINNVVNINHFFPECFLI